MTGDKSDCLIIMALFYLMNGIYETNRFGVQPD